MPLVGNENGEGLPNTPFVSDDEAQILVYPNPSSADVIFEFTLPSKDANVTLDIFNFMGEHVQRIYDGEVEKEVVNTVRIQGKTLAHGTYLYRLHTDNKVYQGKMVILE